MIQWIRSPQSLLPLLELAAEFEYGADLVVLRVSLLEDHLSFRMHGAIFWALTMKISFLLFGRKDSENFDKY